MLELKKSAKQLYISFVCPTNASISLIQALKEFKGLEEITFGKSDGISFTQLDQALRGEHPFLRKVTVSASNLIANEQDNPSPLPHIEVLKLNLYKCSAKDLKLVQLMFPAAQEFYINTVLCRPAYFSNVDDENDTAKEEMGAFFGYVSQTKAFDISIGSLDTNSLEHILRIASKQLQIPSVDINVTPESIFSTFNISTSYEGYKDQQTTHTNKGKAMCRVQITMAVDQVSESSCQSLLKVLAEDVNPRSIEIKDNEEICRVNLSYLYRTVFGNHIDYILTQFKDLKALRLSNMSLAIEASACPAVAKTLELEELEILNCKMSELFFEQLSQKISYIKTLIIGLTSVKAASLKGLSMPYTRLQTLRLNRNIKSCKLSIFLNAASTHLCLDASGFPKPTTCFNIRDFYTYSLRCLSLSELDTTSHQMLLRCKNGRIDAFQQIKS